MFQHPDHHAATWAQLDGIAGGTILDQRFRKRGAPHLRVCSDTRAATAPERRRGLQREAQRARGRFQRTRVLVDQVDQLAAQLVQDAFALRRLQLGLELRAHGFEWLLVAGADLADLDHMPTEVALDRPANFTRLHREGGILERPRQSALCHQPQVATLVLGAGVLAAGLGQCGEIRTRHTRLGGNLVGTRFGSLLVFTTGVGGHLHQDMRHLPLLRRGILGGLFLVTLAQGGFVDHRRGQARSVEFHVFETHGFRASIVADVRLVPGPALCCGHRRSVDGHRRHRHHAYVALFAQQAQQAIDLAVGDKRGLRQAGRDQPVLQAVADFLLEFARRLRRRLRGQQQLVAVGVEATVDLEIRDRDDRVAHLPIADRDAVALGRKAHQLLIDHVVENLALVVCGLERLGVERVALFVAPAHARSLEALAELGAVDVVDAPQHADGPRLRRRLPPARWLGNAHNVGVHPLRQVGLHAEESERDDQQTKDDRSDPAGGLVAEFLQHGRTVGCVAA